PLPGYHGRSPLRNRLFRNLGGHGFEDVTDQAGVDGTRRGKKLYTIGCAVGDYDNDGHEDLFVTGFGGCILYHNNGDGTFSDLTPNLLYINQRNGTFKEEAVSRNCALSDTGQALSGMGVDMGDVDGDLRPDLWVTNYWGENNNLYHNLGGGLFSDVAVASGL